MKKSTLVAMLATLAMAVSANALNSSTTSSLESMGSVSDEVAKGSDFIVQEVLKTMNASGGSSAADGSVGEASEGVYVLSGVVGNVSVDGSTVNDSGLNDFKVTGSKGSVTFFIEGSGAVVQSLAGYSQAGVQGSNDFVFDGSLGQASGAVVGSEVAQASGDASGMYSDESVGSADSVYGSATGGSGYVVTLSGQGVRVSMNGVSRFFEWSSNNTSDVFVASYYSATSQDMGEDGDVSAQSGQSAQAPSQIIESILSSVKSSAESVAIKSGNSIDNTSVISLDQDSADSENSVISVALVAVVDESGTSANLVFSKDVNGDDAGSKAAMNALDSTNGLKSENSANSIQVLAEIPLNASGAGSQVSSAAGAASGGLANTVVQDGL